MNYVIIIHTHTLKLNYFRLNDVLSFFMLNEKKMLMVYVHVKKKL